MCTFMRHVCTESLSSVECRVVVLWGELWVGAGAVVVNNDTRARARQEKKNRCENTNALTLPTRKPTTMTINRSRCKRARVRAILRLIYQEASISVEHMRFVCNTHIIIPYSDWHHPSYSHRELLRLSQKLAIGESATSATRL